MANEKYMEYLAYVKEYLAQNGIQQPFFMTLVMQTMTMAAMQYGAAGLSMNMPRTARWTWRSVRR